MSIEVGTSEPGIMSGFGLDYNFYTLDRALGHAERAALTAEDEIAATIICINSLRATLGRPPIYMPKLSDDLINAA